jgi:hypothetical protein
MESSSISNNINSNFISANTTHVATIDSHTTGIASSGLCYRLGCPSIT